MDTITKTGDAQEYDGDIMDSEDVGLILGLDDYDEHDGVFEEEPWELDDERGLPLDKIYY